MFINNKNFNTSVEIKFSPQQFVVNSSYLKPRISDVAVPVHSSDVLFVMLSNAVHIKNNLFYNQLCATVVLGTVQGHLLLVSPFSFCCHHAAQW
jgi:hypothetical protein